MIVHLFAERLDGAALPAADATDIICIRAVPDGESAADCLARARANTNTVRIPRSQLTNLRPYLPVQPTGMRHITYNVMNEDGPGAEGPPGVWVNDQYGTVAYVRDGHRDAFIYEFPGSAFSILIPSSHYMKSRTEWNRHVMYRNQQGGIRAVGKEYTVRCSMARDNVTTDDILRPEHCVWDHTGQIMLSGNASVPRFKLLRDYENGGRTDTNNPWHYNLKLLEKLASDFKQDVLDGICKGITPVLAGRQEEGYVAEGQDPRYVSDYHPDTIADFKAKMGTTQNPPTPRTLQDQDAVSGPIGKLWFIYRQEEYIFFKKWARGIIRGIIPNCPTGDDYGQVTGADANTIGTGNFRRISADSQIIKINPDFNEVPEWPADLLRSNAPTGAKLQIEADQDWAISGAYSPNPIARNPVEVAEKIKRYFDRGITEVSGGQMVTDVTFRSWCAIVRRCIEIGCLGPVTVIDRPPASRRVSYTTDEMLTQDQQFAYRRWDAAGGQANPVEVLLIDTFTYPQ